MDFIMKTTKIFLHSYLCKILFVFIGELGKAPAAVDDSLPVREPEGATAMPEEEDEDLTSRLEALRSWWWIHHVIIAISKWQTFLKNSSCDRIVNSDALWILYVNYHDNGWHLLHFVLYRAHYNTLTFTIYECSYWTSVYMYRRLVSDKKHHAKQKHF